MKVYKREKVLLWLLTIVFMTHYCIFINTIKSYASDEALSTNLNINNFNFDVYVNAQPKIVTRAEICRFFVKSLGLKLSSSSTRSFYDITSNYEYYKDICAVVNAGLMAGYSDGTFRPEGPITRVEYATYLYKALKYQRSNTEVLANDIKSHWGYEYISTILDAGLMSVDGDNNFRPNDYLTIDFSGQILPIISPVNALNKKVIWKSDNEDIAIVDSTGHVTGKFAGYAAITCSLADNSQSKKCFVRVNTQNYTPPLLNGYISSNATTNNLNFKVYIGESNEFVTTDEHGYFQVEGSLSDINIPIKIKVTKDGYLSRFINIYNYGELSTKENPLEIWCGDINSDLCINMTDIVLIAKSFNSSNGQSNYNRICDLNFDGFINIADVVCIAKKFGTSSENY